MCVASSTSTICESRAVSDARFADGLRYRIEIPSVEGPARAARGARGGRCAAAVPVRRVSQGSRRDDAHRRRRSPSSRSSAPTHGVEVSLFLGPRGAWDTGGQSAAAGAVERRRTRCGRRRVMHRRGVPGRRARDPLLPGRRRRRARDPGRGWKRTAELPPGLVLKTSVLLPCANPPTAHKRSSSSARITINVSTDLSVRGTRRASRRQLGAARRLRRSAGRSGWLRPPVRGPRHGSVPRRHFYVKLGLRNAPNI